MSNKNVYEKKTTFVSLLLSQRVAAAVRLHRWEKKLANKNVGYKFLLKATHCRKMMSCYQ